MKIQHWAIIFIIIILPFSIICRDTIKKKNILLRDETRINNIVDNATYDAVSQIVEVSEELGYGKNIPMTYGVADAAIDRFFNTLSVNFNLPIGRQKAEEYFSPYIPAIVIVGYDGLYVYSYEQTNSGYDFTLKPKIPYACTYSLDSLGAPGKSVTIHFTLDNYVTVYFPDDVFLKDAPDALGNLDNEGTHFISGYVGEVMEDAASDPYEINTGIESDGTSRAGSDIKQINYIKNTLPMFTDNLSYILKEWASRRTTDPSNRARYLTVLYEDNANQDYVYDDDGNITVNASEFHVLRRETIINLITSVLREEFNEHNHFSDTLGLTYEFNIPEIGRDQWNNTINDVSVLAFFQGMPIGADSYYNNYSLGGTRIVQSSYLYAERVREGSVSDSAHEHKVYHKHYCPYIPRDEHGEILYGDSSSNNFKSIRFSDGTVRYTSGIEEIFVNTTHAKEMGYYVCSHCM